MWVFWQPDQKLVLKRFGVEDEIKCECSVCQWMKSVAGALDELPIDWPQQN
jgi:hypothetical protein